MPRRRIRRRGRIIDDMVFLIVIWAMVMMMASLVFEKRKRLTHLAENARTCTRVRLVKGHGPQRRAQTFSTVIQVCLWVSGST
mmetsp:Transcript_16933/g.40509  ORF Transcript_16933/g.40509 Transcript_16933/m.40509 type:complete len:83 (+) Transcript_16933:184-432(+)